MTLPSFMHHHSRAAFAGDADAIQALLGPLDAASRASALAAYDPHGNTALHVAVIARKTAAMEALLAAGAEVGLKNRARWNAMDEAIALDDRAACQLLLLRLRAEWRAKKASKKEQLLTVLRELPDFRLKLKWELGSRMVGALVRRFAPDDTYTITKVGSRLRVDGTLMGLDRSSHGIVPRWNRGSFSLLIDAAPSPAPRFFANHGRRRFVDLYRARKERRKDVDKEVDLLLEHGGEKVKMRTTGSDFRPVKSWLGRPVHSTIDGWKTQARGGGEGRGGL